MRSTEKQDEVFMVYTKQDTARIEHFLDVGQVAEMLGLSIAIIRKWVLIRYIPFSASEIREWVKTRTVKPAEEQGRSGNEGGNE
jgi:predicted DNA-binding transcriptional regulator AlpA